MRDMMEDKKVVVWANMGGIMRDKKADKKVFVWAKSGGIMRDKKADKKVIVWANVEGYHEGQDGRKEGHDVGQVIMRVYL